MNDFRVMMLLTAARSTILRQRAEIAELAPKAHAYDTLAATVRLNTQPHGGGAEVDITWEIEQVVQASLNEDKPAEEMKSPPEPAPRRRKPGPKAKAEQFVDTPEPVPAPRRRRAKAAS